MNKITPDTRAEFKGQIIDIFEDFLADKNMNLNNPEKDAAVEDGEYENVDEMAIIYGDDYDRIGDEIDFIINDNNLMNGKVPTVSTADIRTIMNAFFRLCLNSDIGNIMSFSDVDKYMLVQKVTDTFKKWDITITQSTKSINDLIVDNSFTVALFKKSGDKKDIYEFKEHLYEFIEDIKEAYLLAHYAMDHDRTSSDDLVVVFPGHNIGVKYNEDTLKLAEQLAKKYKPAKKQD